MELKVFSNSDSKEWDKLVSESDYKTIFHTWDWISTIQNHGGGKLHALVGFKGGEASVLMPFFVQRRMGFTLLLSPPPQTATPYMGPIFQGYNKLKQSRRESSYLEFKEALKEYIYNEIKPDYEFILSPPGLIDIRPWQWDGYTASPLYEYYLNLTVGLETLKSNLKRNLRNDIKNTQEAGVTIRIGGEIDFLGLIEDTKKRYLEQGLRDTTSNEFLNELYDKFHKENMRVLVAEHKGERLAGIIELMYCDTVTSWLGGVRHHSSGLSPNQFVHWEGLRIAAEGGFKNYVEIGANTRHLCTFKRQFNSIPLGYFSLKRYPNPLMRAVESGYVKVLKPIRAMIKTGGKP